MYSNTKIYLLYLTTSFCHNSHQQAIKQKLKKAGTYSTKLSVYMGSNLDTY